ncbi:MAG: nitronate monooxygenase [Deltaproteobacteria bacterium]|nr:nitronate monooxygenase [Deltaproteobacteria bacterium]
MKVPSFLNDAQVEIPIICGAMYPCSNPELVAAASEAGGLGIVQPLSLTYVHGHDLRDGLRRIRELTDKPIGFNVIVEKSVRIYEKRMQEWVDIALEEGVRFFITALGDPKWVVERAEQNGGVVYHDVTNRKHADKALARGVKGLLCVNNRAGGHAGVLSPQQLYNDLQTLDVPLICAGGIGDRESYLEALSLGYQAVQMGTRFIATKECTAHDSYKQAIINAKAEDIVLTDRVTGVPLAVINTPYLKKVGARAGWFARWLLKGRKTKHLMRLIYSLKSVFKLKNANFKPLSTKDFWQAGKSVAGVKEVLSVKEVFSELTS